MNAARELAPYESAIQRSKDRFQKVQSLLSYDRESIFAMQALMKSDFTLATANKNPQSVHLAMVNLASTGLTLNPANKYAFLVPRDGAIVLDISYKGLIKIATDTGSVKWARADVVYEKDQFIYQGPARLPCHEAKPFDKDRGEIVGAYCIAKTHDGDFLTEVIDLAELEHIRSKSQAWDKKKSGPWVDFFGEMCKKATVKRASKTWPYTEQSERLHEAVQVANDAEGGYAMESGASAAANLTIEDTRKARHDEALEQYEQSVTEIQRLIGVWDETKDNTALLSVSKLWYALPQTAQMDLWLAPTKGGIFTTHERDVIKTRLERLAADA